MDIEIRPIETLDEYRAFEDLELEIWGGNDIVADHILITAQKNGGLVLGAFVPAAKDEVLVALLFGFVGLTPEGKTKHCSHIVGVAPHCQSKGIGYQLKMAQLDHVLSQGIDLITWTFDPLESRNANLNFHKLGTVCNTYWPNLYGDMRERLNAGLPSDRFQVDWHIASRHVVNRLNSSEKRNTLSDIRRKGTLVVNPFSAGELSFPPECSSSPKGNTFLVQIPARFQAIKGADLKLALAWREHTRAIFQSAFAEGHVVTDLLHDDSGTFYLLEKNWSPLGD